MYDPNIQIHDVHCLSDPILINNWEHGTEKLATCCYRSDCYNWETGLCIT